MIRTVLIAFDFSPASRRALELGVLLGQKLGAEVHAVTVLDEDDRSAPQLKALARALELDIESGLRQPDNTVHCHALAGDPTQEIIRLAQEISAPMIVVGTTGKGAVARTLLGSVSSGIVKQSGAIVVTVP